MAKATISRLEHKIGTIRINHYPENPLDIAYEILPHDIIFLKGALPFAKDLIRLSNDLNLWEESTIYSGENLVVDNIVRNNSRLTVAESTNKLFVPFKKLLEIVMHSAAKLYALDNEYVTMVGDEGYQLLRYSVNQHYYPHCDSSTGASSKRTLSAVGFLNDDFEGGQLYFPRQGVMIKPIAGSIVLFPPYYTHVHEAKDVTKGIKYSVVTWFHTV